ncbi:S8 family serine peptidase [Bacillus infantis]|uniref:S8 family serine peptidase n=1 Tax=Bacillus infantis TaxID=324767 RepID=UPI003CFB5450
MKNKKQFRWLYLMLTALLIIPVLSPYQAQADAGKSPHVSMKKASPGSSKNKISGRLLDQFDGKDKVTFLIKMKEQADTKKAAQEAAKKASADKATSSKAKFMKRSAVVSSLRAVAAETQAGVLKYIEQQEKAGKAKDSKSFYIVNSIAVTATKDVMEKLASFPEVDKILPNETRELHKPVKEASKPSIQMEQTADNKTSSIEWNIDRVGAPAAWDMGIDGSGTVVASIDTGVQWNHPALKEKYRGYDPANPDQPSHTYNWFDAVGGQSSPYDDDGHGTHVTGTMVGSDPGGANQIGVAPGAKFIAVKAFSPSGGSDVDLLAAGEWILAPKDANGTPHPEQAPDVVNNSWGGGPGLDEWYRPMVQSWRAAEIFPEFSAGNTTLTNPGGPGSVASPGNYPESYATGATDINNRLGSFSLQGPSPYEEIKPDIAAPGVNIRSSVPGSGYEGGWNGTSMAGPHVAAAAALLRQADSSLTVDEIEEILSATAVPLTDSTFPNVPNNGYGHGLVNVFDAVSSVVSGLGKLKGQVSKEGDDSEAPSISHDAQTETYAGMDLAVRAEVSDNISVTNVVLEYVKADGNTASVGAERVSGSFTDGIYEAVIPGEDIREPILSYQWKAVDFGGNSAESDTFEVNVIPGISTGYSQDFESQPAGWTSYGTNDSWEWGAPASGPGNAASGEKVYATALGGNYANSANMTLLMPPVDLGEGNAYLQFKQWHELENRYDYGHVFVSADMENWTQKLRVNGNTAGWIDGEVDLSEYAGQRIYIAFNVTTDSSVQKLGWYLDDVSLSDTPKAPSKKGQLGKNGTAGPSGPAVSAKKQIDPAKIVPEKEQGKKEQENGSAPSPALLPVNAEVTVLETGRSVFTDPQDGSYEMTHASGTYTVQAEAYGFRSESQSVNIPEDGEASANFVLGEIPEGTIEGIVTNELTGEPVPGAMVMLIEDAAVEPVYTDENGQYSLTAYEGTYTLKAVAPSYYSEEVEITIEGSSSAEQNIQLRPFIGYPGEIGYDDGTAENARAFYDAGNGWAVKMSLENGQNSAMVTGGIFRFWDTEWPVPGGTEFQVAVYDASGPDGAPGKKLAGPFEASALRNGEWTRVDLRDKGIMVNGDFYMVYIQSAPNPNTPGLATDEDGPNAGRSWQLVGGAWSPVPAEEGNYMIRAAVDYEVNAPVITSPADGTVTKQKNTVIEGTSAPSTTVHLFINGEKAAETTADDSGKFSAEAELNEGENILTAKAATDSGSTDFSAPVTVIVDTEKPELSITSPADDLKTNKETITVQGTVADVNLDWVKVNGTKAAVQDGAYSLRILLNEGENTITVIAQDKAKNKTNKKVTVYAKYTAPVIENLLPEENKDLKSGESVKIEFDSEPGLKAVFSIRMPLTNTGGQLTNAVELPMMETSEGHYEGYYTATKNVKAPGAEIEVKVTDDFGNEVRQTAAGKLNINAE